MLYDRLARTKRAWDTGSPAARYREERINYALTGNERHFRRKALDHWTRFTYGPALKQLYFIVQVILMNPQGAPEAREMLRRSMPLLLATFSDEHILCELKNIDRQVSEGRVFEALKALRSLDPREAGIIASGNARPSNLVLTAAE